MKLKKQLILAATLAAICCFTACSSESEQSGGMDGAGSIAIGFWEHDLFFQQFWLDEQFVFTVYNRANTSAEVEVHTTNCSDTCGSASTVLETWHVPAASVTTFSGADVDDLLTDGLLMGYFRFSAEGQTIGQIDSTPKPVMGSGLTVVSTSSLNWIGGHYGQVDTAFATVNSPEFTLTLVLSQAGTLTLHRKTPPFEGLQFVDIVGVDSPRYLETNTVVITAIPGDELPMPETSSRFIIDATEATAVHPLRVDVHVAMPAGFTGQFIGFDAKFCWVPLDAAYENCSNGGGIVRGFAVTND